MNWTAVNRVRNSVWNVPAISLAVAVVGGLCVPGLAQPNWPAAKSSAGRSAAGLSSLPPDAQGPISAALGRDDSGYWVHRTAAGFRGENPRQALEAEFTRQGAEVRSHNVRWRLETRGYGYGDALHPVEAAAPTASANRVEYRRDGVTEWYENGPLGLEQGFTLARRPGRGNGGALTLELDLTGDLAATLEPAANGLELRRSNGEAAFRYTGLKARDATGRPLRSWLEVRGARLLVRVEDAGARYPVVVDPWVQQAELTASDGAANDHFGSSVAVSGSVAVVGAYNHTVGTNAQQGAAYVFVESGGTWSQQAKLTAPDGAAKDNFGSSVAVSGSTAVVGTPFHKVGSNTNQGAAYVFVESGGTWSEQAELTASDGAAKDNFGYSVAVSGITAVVGAPVHTVGSHANQGAAYVFVQSGTMWSEQAELTASDGAAKDNLGWSAAVSGSTAVVGAPFHKIGANPFQGAAYVFIQSGTTWTQQAVLTAADGAPDDQLGYSVAVSPSTAVVGAPAHTVGSNPLQGAAYVFVQSGTMWTQQAELAASDGTAGDALGVSVVVRGSTAAVGAPYRNHMQGAAYVFVQSGTMWSQQAELAASDGAVGDLFGWSVAVSGSTAVVGAFFHTVGSNIGQGAAYVFSLVANSCSGAYIGTFNGNITTGSGDYCEIDGGTVHGNLTSNGGTVVLRNATVTGNLQISGTYTGTGPNLHMVCGSVIQGNLQFQNDTDPITIGGPSGTSCGPSTVGNDLQVHNNSGAISVTYDNIGGNLQVQNNTGLVTVTNNTTRNDLQVGNNTGGVTVDTNRVGDNLQVRNNLPSALVYNNTATGNLQCDGNASISGGGNTAKQKQGQCASY